MDPSWWTDNKMETMPGAVYILLGVMLLTWQSKRVSVRHLPIYLGRYQGKVNTTWSSCKVCCVDICDIDDCFKNFHASKCRN